MAEGKARAAKEAGKPSPALNKAAREAKAKAAAAEGRAPPSSRGTASAHAALRNLLPPARSGSARASEQTAPRVIRPAAPRAAAPRARPSGGPRMGPTQTIHAQRSYRTAAVRGLLPAGSGRSTVPPDFVGRRGGTRKKPKKKGPAMAAKVISTPYTKKAARTPAARQLTAGPKKKTAAMTRTRSATPARRRARLPGIPAPERRIRKTAPGRRMLAQVGPATKAISRTGNRRGVRFRKLQWDKTTRYLDLSTGKRTRAVETRKFGRNPIGGAKDIISTGLAAIGGAVVSEFVSRIVATRMPEGGKHPFYSKDAALRILAKPTAAEGVANGVLIAGLLGGAGWVARKGYGMWANVLGGMGFGAIAHYGVRVVMHYLAPMLFKVDSGDEQTWANRLLAWEQPSNADAIEAEIVRTNKPTSEAQADPLGAAYKNGDTVTEGGYKWTSGKIIGIAPPQDAPKSGSSTTKGRLAAQADQARVFDSSDLRAQPETLGSQGGQGGRSGGGQQRAGMRETQDAFAGYLEGTQAKSRTGCGGGCGKGGGCNGGCNGKCGEDCGCADCQAKWGQGGPQGGGTLPQKREQYAPSEAGQRLAHNMNECPKCVAAFKSGKVSPCVGQGRGQQLHTQPEQPPAQQQHRAPELPPATVSGSIQAWEVPRARMPEGVRSARR